MVDYIMVMKMQQFSRKCGLGLELRRKFLEMVVEEKELAATEDRDPKKMLLPPKALREEGDEIKIIGGVWELPDEEDDLRPATQEPVDPAAPGAEEQEPVVEPITTDIGEDLMTGEGDDRKINENKGIDRFRAIIKQEGVPWIDRMDGAIVFMTKYFTMNGMTCRPHGAKVASWCRDLQSLEEDRTTRFGSLSGDDVSPGELSTLKARRNDFELKVKKTFIRLLSFQKYEEGKAAEKKMRYSLIIEAMRQARESGAPYDYTNLIDDTIKKETSLDDDWTTV